MLTNSVYPGSILIGGLARWQRSRSRPALLGLVTFAAAAFTLIATWPGLTPYLPPPAAIETATRIHDHAPPDIVVAGNFHQLGYLSWRRQQHPPLPASESRNAPALVTLRRLSTLDEWRAWRHAHGLSPWFIDPIESPPHPDLRTVFTNSLFRIRTLED